MATVPKESTTNWAMTQYLPILLLVFVIILGAVAFYDKTVQDDDIEVNNDRSLQNQADISNSKSPSETVVKGWVNTANEKLRDKDAAIETRVTTLENKPATQTNVAVTASEETEINNRIQSLENKLKLAEDKIKDIEDDNSSGSSSSRNNNRDIRQDTTMNTPNNFYDKGERITFNGFADSNADVELWISYERGQFERVGDNDANSSGLWVISCISKCTEDRGDYEIYAVNTDNNDKSRTYDYEVD